MLKTRIITAVALLAVLLPVLFLNSFPAFAAVALLFYVAAIWEAYRLFGHGGAGSTVTALVWGVGFCLVFYIDTPISQPTAWFVLAVALWSLRFVPGLALGLPALGSPSSRILMVLYLLSIAACFAAVIALFRHSPAYLLSVMALVWIADIGAYFSGKALGKRKLAPSISPGKSWEGAIGGGFAVLLLSTLAVQFGGPSLDDTFVVRLQAALGWPLALAVLLLIVAASVVGDLVESQLKRRAGVKDSSALLPGHGGVLDRIDALIPVLPLAALINTWL
jgi:phosphatidate cytidylyltransferase